MAASLDDVDLRLLGELERDADRTNVELSRIVGLSPAAMSRALDTPGANNDLTDALRLAPGVREAARRSVEPTLAALAGSQHLIEFARPYSPDLLAVLGKLDGQERLQRRRLVGSGRQFLQLALIVRPDTKDRQALCKVHEAGVLLDQLSRLGR